MLTEKIKEDINKALGKYKHRRSCCMAALQIAQKERGFLTKEDMEEVAGILGIQPVIVEEVAAFYTMYNVEKPVGKHHIQVCRNLSCSLLGVEHIIKHIEKFLNIKAGETTQDKRFTLSLAECLGSCGTAPMMQINEDYYENLTEKRVEEIIKGLK